ncbi:cache domain-containing sensor histidine kinase [Gorillibacterium sp. sgz5001074]|uniref:cache domain-containing sensor histidine kinase n=1 Tax=Gorillibacterium sp. sgz5001074 TaxID=3446695 RepID=UPI003F66D3BD
MWKWLRFELNDMPIRYKLIAHFLLISILPSIGMGFLVGLVSDRVIERQVNDNTLQLISKANKTLEFYTTSLQNMTYLISFNPTVAQFLQNPRLQEDKEYELRQFLQGFTTLHTEVSGILVADAKGGYISNELYGTGDGSLREEAWFTEAVRNEGLFKVLGHPNGRRIASHANYREDEVISVVRAILDPQTQALRGVVLIDLKLRVIAETVKDVRLGKTGYLMVIDGTGESIYSPRNPLVEQIPAGWLGDSVSGTFSKTIEGERLQFIYQKSPFTGWTTVGVFSSRETVQESRQIQFFVVSFVFVICLLGVAASLYLSHSISRPIVHLNMLMHRAEGGDWNSRYQGNRKDEVGQLGRSFNAMISQIAKLLQLTEQQAKQKREAEFRSLQAQIKPHFLYNTLDTIQWMARKEGVEEVATVVGSLAKLFRIGLSKGNDVIRLTEEIEHIQSYLVIQKTRYLDKLNYTVEMDPVLERLWVLKLLLQPLVENAIYHGIKERRGPGHISIEAKRESGLLVLRVTDDGKGMTEEVLADLRRSLNAVSADEPEGAEEKERSGYGLLNVQARIRLTFGDAYGLTVESELGKGTSVTIRHPYLDDYTKGEGDWHVEGTDRR